MQDAYALCRIFKKTIQPSQPKMVHQYHHQHQYGYEQQSSSIDDFDDFSVPIETNNNIGQHCHRGSASSSHGINMGDMSWKQYLNNDQQQDFSFIPPPSMQSNYSCGASMSFPALSKVCIVIH